MHDDAGLNVLRCRANIFGTRGACMMMRGLMSLDVGLTYSGQEGRA